MSGFTTETHNRVIIPGGPPIYGLVGAGHDYPEQGLYLSDYPLEEDSIVSPEEFAVAKGTEIAVKTVMTMFPDHDSSLVAENVHDGMERLINAMVHGLSSIGDIEPFPALWVANEGEGEPTFSDVLEGHRRIVAMVTGRDTTTDTLPGFWQERSAKYLNRRLPDDTYRSFGELPLQVLGLVKVKFAALDKERAFRVGIGGECHPGQPWVEQQAAFRAWMSNYYESSRCQGVVGGINPVDWLMVSAQRMVRKVELSKRLDAIGTTRFIQHDTVKIDDGIDRGPEVFLGEGYQPRFGIEADTDTHQPSGGFRVVVKPES